MGRPVLRTGISTVANGRLLYRGQDACKLADTATLEDIATLLWQRRLRSAVWRHQSRWLRPVRSPLSRWLAALPRHRRQPAAASLTLDAGSVLGTIATALAGTARPNEPLDLRLARHWGRPHAADIIRRALVLLADHELNASTFAARVAVSTGASLWSGALAGLATLNGPRHGLASRAVTVLAEDIGHAPGSADIALLDWLGEGRHIPGMGHQLYPEGDVRALTLLEHFTPPTTSSPCETPPRPSPVTLSTSISPWQRWWRHTTCPPMPP